MLKVTLVGGPMGGRVVEVPADATRYRVGRFWTYEPVGKGPGGPVFAKRPRSRAVRRRVAWIAAAFSKDPRVEPRPQPFTYGSPDKRRVARRTRVTARKLVRKGAA
jgi:hypothetical protein